MAELERCRLQQLLILSPSAARVVGDNAKPLEERQQLLIFLPLSLKAAPSSGAALIKSNIFSNLAPVLWWETVGKPSSGLIAGWESPH
jgi:hypothetical protein